jgi:hypothetical protein
MAQPSSLLPRVHAILRANQSRRHAGRPATITLAASAAIIALLAGGSAIVKADPAKTQAAAREGTPAASPAALHPIEAKLDSIIIPVVSFDDTSLTEALDYLRTRSEELDPDQAHPGINIIAQLPHLPEQLSSDYIVHATYLKTIARGITIDAEQIPLRVLLDLICTITGTSWRSSEHAVIISFGRELLSKNFSVPSEIMEAELAHIVKRDGDQDPFGVVAPPTALDWFRLHGIEFGDGCGAFYTKAAGVLNVRNTPEEMAFIEAIIDSLNARSLGSALTPVAATRLAQLKHDLRTIIIPELNLQDASLRDSLDYLRAVARERSADPSQPSPLQFFVNVDDRILKLAADEESAIRISLNLRQVPLGVAVNYIIDLAKMHSVVRPYGIEIGPHDADRLQLATLRLSPENMKSIRESITVPPLPHPTATRTLVAVGIPFGPNAGAFWNERTGDLIVRQTVDNLSRIETFLEGLQPAQQE